MTKEDQAPADTGAVPLDQQPRDELMERAREQREYLWDRGRHEAALVISDFMREVEALRAERDDMINRVERCAREAAVMVSQAEAEVRRLQAVIAESDRTSVLQAVLDAIKGTLDPSTQIADHPNVKFAQMQRLKWEAQAGIAPRVLEMARVTAKDEHEYGMLINHTTEPIHLGHAEPFETCPHPDCHAVRSPQ